jgi:dipeptidyl aminopeptidase/acylaminoacyl peptidase
LVGRIKFLRPTINYDSREENMAPQIAPYGAWKSPISAQEAFAKFVGLGGIQTDGADLYWCEYRPDGRTVIVRRSADGAVTDITPAGYNVRTRVHEYGGGDYLVTGGVVYFSNFSDQRIYRQELGSVPVPLTRLDGMRYADMIIDLAHSRIIAVREDHVNPSRQAINTLVSINLDGYERELVSGNDFYSTPRLSPDGKHLCWLTWNHPNMPWDGTELWVVELFADGSLGHRILVAGGLSESIFQPEWSPSCDLYFVSDRTGWWNLYRWRIGQNDVQALHPVRAEFGQPQWEFGMTTYAFEPTDRVICTYIKDGRNFLAWLDMKMLELHQFDIPYDLIHEIHTAHGLAYFIAGSATQPTTLVQMDIASGEIKVIRQGRTVTIDPGYFSIPKSVEFPTENGLTAFGFYYPPKNRDYNASAGELPPLIVKSHGGPTSSASAGLQYGIQYWTTRGFAVLDVNYGGSTGYGRAYRERLKGQWGIVDVADCVNGARYLASQGLVDPERLAIRGGSAGGYVTLCAITFHKVFSAAACYYGISDLEAMAGETHKFESRYLDSLIGPYPERRDLYIARSPIHYIDQITCPLILLQGMDDPVVPPNQSQMIYDALLRRGLPVALLTFPGEQHGFVKAENNIRALEAELYFYSQIFKFELAEQVEPVTINAL